VRPLAVDRTEVIFDFYFADVSESARAHNLASIEVGDRIQQEDLTSANRCTKVYPRELITRAACQFDAKPVKIFFTACYMRICPKVEPRPQLPSLNSLLSVRPSA
jgi:hypothetical protein